MVKIFNYLFIAWIPLAFSMAVGIHHHSLRLSWRTGRKVSDCGLIQCQVELPTFEMIDKLNTKSFEMVLLAIPDAAL